MFNRYKVSEKPAAWLHRRIIKSKKHVSSKKRKSNVHKKCENVFCTKIDMPDSQEIRSRKPVDNKKTAAAIIFHDNIFSQIQK